MSEPPPTCLRRSMITTGPIQVGALSRTRSDVAAPFTIMLVDVSPRGCFIRRPWDGELCPLPRHRRRRAGDRHAASRPSSPSRNEGVRRTSGPTGTPGHVGAPRRTGRVSPNFSGRPTGSGPSGIAPPIPRPVSLRRRPPAIGVSVTGHGLRLASSFSLPAWWFRGSFRGPARPTSRSRRIPSASARAPKRAPTPTPRPAHRTPTRSDGYGRRP